jgi:hypothetical protein
MSVEARRSEEPAHEAPFGRMRMGVGGEALVRVRLAAVDLWEGESEWRISRMEIGRRRAW